MNRNQNKCGLRILPYGYGKPYFPNNGPSTCMSPCSQKGPVNVQVQGPTYQGAFPQNESGDGSGSNGIGFLQESSLAPINVNLKMCKEQDTTPAVESQYEAPCQPCVPTSRPMQSVNVCGTDCNLCNYEVRKPGCQPINFVEKTCPIIPAKVYNPNTDMMDSRTVYQSEYVPKIVEKTKPFIPKPKYTKLQDPLKGESLYKEDFIAFPTIPYVRPIWSEKELFKPGEGYVNGTTTYKSSFQPVHGCPAISAKPGRRLDPNMGPLNDQSTYKIDYVGYGNCVPTKNYAPGAALVEENGAVFDGRTMYNVSYRPPCVGKPVESFKPKRYLAHKTRPLDGRTTYQQAFLPFAFQKCKQPPKEDCFSDYKLSI